MHHFMWADLLASLASVGLYALLLFTPGYVIAWLADLFGFRRRTPEFRISLSIPLSIATSPILIYLAGRFASMAAAGGVLAATWIWFAVLLARHGLGRPRFPRPAVLVVLAWLALTLVVSVDVQVGVRDYYPVTALDYSVRSEFIHSIARTGIPPANPFFFPGHTVPLRYHYFWLLLPAMVCQGTGYAIGPRAAWIGSVFWCGLGLLCLVGITFRVFWYRGAASFSRRAIVGILLLGVTGLDILPTAFLWLLQASGMPRAVLGSLEWWNEMVDGFGHTALWEAHHLSGLIACLMAFLLLQEGPRQRTFVRRASYAGIAGLALADATGSSIHIAFVFAAYLVIWMVIVLAKGWRREAVSLAIAGAIAMALALPNALALRGGLGGPGGAAAPIGAPIQFCMRRFLPLNALLQALGVHSAWILGLVNAAALPLNYFMELGFFFVAGVAWWRRRRSSGKPLSQGELALAVLVSTSILICTFLRSSLISNNDLGWRGFLLAQFGLLLWSVDVLFDQPRTRGLTALLVLGALGTTYDAAILRLYPVLADAGVVANLGWMAPDRQLGRRNYLAREAYEWIAQSTSPDAHIQFDPHVTGQDTSAMLYARRPIVASDLGCLAAFGGDPSLCASLIAKVTPLYPPRGQPAAASIETACQSLPVDILVAKDTDSAWADPHGWVWNEKPVFANRDFRVFRCGGNAPASRSGATSLTK